MQKLLEIGIKKRNGEIDKTWNELAKDTPFKSGEAHKKCTVCGREDGCRCYSKPPTGGSGVIKPCEHDYEYLYPEYSVVEGDYGDLYIQEDVFYCRKCLDRKTVLARQVKRERPYWFKG